jgi:hypothetical protein
MTITNSPGCSFSHSTPQGATFNCMMSATFNISSCTTTMTNEPFQTSCDENYNCLYAIAGLSQNLTCDGSTFDTIYANGPNKVSESGSCTCQAGAATVPSGSPSASATGTSSPQTQSSGSSNMLRTSTALLLLSVVAFNIAGNI